MKSSINFTIYRRYKFLNNREIDPTDWCSTGTVPPQEKENENLKTIDWGSTEGGVPPNGEKVVHGFPNKPNHFSSSTDDIILIPLPP